VNYQPISVDSSKRVFGHEIPYDKVWAPGGKPMTMFLNHPVMLEGKDIPVGAYTMFVIPDDDKWTLIISRSTDTSGKYDEHQDLMRCRCSGANCPVRRPDSAFISRIPLPTNAPCGSISGKRERGLISRSRSEVKLQTLFRLLRKARRVVSNFLLAIDHPVGA